MCPARADTFEDIHAVARTRALAAIGREDPTELAVVVLAVALHEPDLDWALSFVMGLVNHAHTNVRGNAVFLPLA